MYEKKKELHWIIFLVRNKQLFMLEKLFDIKNVEL